MSREIGRIELSDKREIVFYEDRHAAIYDIIRGSTSVTMHFTDSDMLMIRDWFNANEEGSQ